MTNPKIDPCILPWINFGTTPFGKPRPCGYSAFKGETAVQASTISAEFNSELFKTIRKDFIAGQWPKNCDRCKYVEESKSGRSKKDVEHKRFEQLKDLIDQTHPDGSVNYFPRQIDIRLGTLCNLKCIHCGTGNSSKWMEDKDILGKYQNTQVSHIDNSWVDRETPLWKDIFENIHQIERFNFLGGEPFASRQHLRFIERVSKTPFAKNISLHYVTNGTILNERIIDTLRKFRAVTINVSLDASGLPLEFFRFPINASSLHANLRNLETSLGDNFDLRLQWTSSNVSIFYLDQTLDYFLYNFSRFKFTFCNFVDYPTHMSPQNLPADVKARVHQKLSPYREQFPEIDFYLKQMSDKDLWPEHGSVFMNYMDDLSRVRKIDWRHNLKEFEELVRANTKEMHGSINPL